MEGKLKIMETETQTLFDLEYGEKHSETWKMLNAYCRTCNISRELKKNVENEKHALQDLEYSEK